MSEHTVGQLLRDLDQALVDDLMRDNKVLDELAELFRLPEWRIDDSASEFLVCAANILRKARNIDQPARKGTLDAYGYGEEGA